MSGQSCHKSQSTIIAGPLWKHKPFYAISICIALQRNHVRVDPKPFPIYDMWYRIATESFQGRFSFLFFLRLAICDITITTGNARGWFFLERSSFSSISNMQGLVDLPHGTPSFTKDFPCHVLLATWISQTQTLTFSNFVVWTQIWALFTPLESGRQALWSNVEFI